MINRIKVYSEILKNNNIKIDIPNFKQVLTEEELIELLPNYDGWIIGDDPATKKVLEAGKKGKLRACIKWGVGTDNVDFDACNELNIPVTNIPNVFGEEVSDVALGYLLCLTRKLHTIHNHNMKNEWFKPVGMSLSGKKVCLIGFGDIGCCIARKLLAFNLDVFVSDPAFKKSSNGNIILNYGHGPKYGEDISKYNDLKTVEIKELDECLDNADFIIVSCPLNKHTKGLINKINILKAKRGVIIINVARGPIVDENDVVELLEDGFIDSVGFDVFEQEPLPIKSGLRKFPQNIYGSHNGSNTIEAVDKTSIIAINKINEYLNYK
jgi:D-3-phosphoglycerate dehydrogenase